MGTSIHPYPVKYVSAGRTRPLAPCAPVSGVSQRRILVLFRPGDLLPVMCDRAGFLQDTSLILYEVWRVYLSTVPVLVVCGGWRWFAGPGFVSV